MTSFAVWNAGTHATDSRGKDCVAHRTKEIKHPVGAVVFRPCAEARGKPRSLARGERKSIVVALRWSGWTRQEMGTINERIRLTKDSSYMLETIKMIIPLICNHVVIVFLELFVCKLFCHKSLFCFSPTSRPSNHIYLFANYKI